MTCKNAATAYLACNFTLELNPLILINEAKLLQHGDTLPVVREELQVLIGHELLQSGDVVCDEPLIVAHAKVLDEVWALDTVACLSCIARSASTVEGFADGELFEAGPV